MHTTPALFAVLLVLAAAPAPGQAAGPDLERAERLMREREFKAAGEAFEEAIRRDPSDWRGHQGAALALARRRRYQEASVRLAHALQLDPQNPALVFDLASSLQNQSRWGEAIVQWRRVESLGVASEKVATTPEIPYNRGYCAMKLELVPEAIEALTRATMMAPGRQDIRETLAGVLINAGRYSEAAREFRMLVEALPSKARHHYHLGVAALQTGDDAAAEKHLKEARRLDPRDPEASLRLGRLFLRRKKNDLAYAFYQEAAEKNSLSADAWYNLSRIATAMKHPDDAADFMKRFEAAQKKKDEVDARTRDLNRRVVIDPADVAAWFDLAVLQLEHQAFDVATETLSRLLAVAPRHEIALLNLASLLARKGMYSEAILELDKILESDPGHPWANLDTGRLKLQNRDVAGAVENLQRGIDRMPADDERTAQAVGLLGEAAAEAKCLGRVAHALAKGLMAVKPGHAVHARAALRYAQASLENQRPADAIPVLEAAAGHAGAADPLRTPIFRMLAALAEANGDPRQAEAYRKVIEGS